MKLLATIASAVIYGVAFPPQHGWMLEWIALVPWLLALRGCTAWQAIYLAWIWTMTLSLTVIPWFGASAAAYFVQPPTFGVVLLVVVPTITGAFEYAGFALIYRLAARCQGATVVLLTAAGWVAAELARTKLFFGNPWELAAYSQLDAGTIVQIADATGIYGVGFLVAATNAAVVEVVLALRRTRPWPSVLRAVGLVSASIVAAVTYGSWRSRVACPATDGVVVAAVQGNVDTGTQWRPEFYGSTLETYLGLSHRALVDRRPRVLFWPENAMTFFVTDAHGFTAAIAKVLSPFEADLVAGGPTAVGTARDAYLNSAHLLRADGRLAGRYDKQYLIPFAERFPLLRSEAILERFARVREFEPGAPGPPLATRAGPVGVLICNEGLFPEPAAAHVRAGAAYLAVLANDAWTSSRQYGETALAYSRVRAIEQRRWVVRASTSGPSAIVDPCGTVVARTRTAVEDVVAAAIVPRSDLTTYAVVGDAFAWCCVGLLGLRLLVHGRWTRSFR